jgi:hypothetical protein
MAALFAIAPAAPYAQPASEAQVQNYRPIFQSCRTTTGPQRLAIRRMELDGTPTLLTVDPESLATSLQPAQNFSCTDTTDQQQQPSRYLRAIQAATTPHTSTPPSAVIANGGLRVGPPNGAFITGDLCPSRRPLDRAFLQSLETQQSPLPLALSLSGTWLTHHRADYTWLLNQQRAGALQVTWVDHSYHHPYTPGRPLADNFLLTPGTNPQSEIFATERLLIANHQTPSVFFRFPGLISNPALMQLAATNHLIVLGAAAWLANTHSAHPGDIILIHLNGNEPAGLAIFSNLMAAGKLPQPFKPIDQAP